MIGILIGVWVVGWILTWGYLDSVKTNNDLDHISTWALGVVALVGWPFYAAKALFVRLEPRAKKR